jgi:diketogulonate reductase-like aldo/keto reductase
MRRAQLPSGEPLPVLGQGTWCLGDSRKRRSEEIATLQLGVDLGMTLIDTAEMYGDGAAEELVADAVAGRRAEVFIVTKVLPGNATSRQRLVAACERSLRRLRTDCIDLYLLHWRGQERLAEVVETFGELRDSGKIRHWGVSNFDAADLEELRGLPGGDAVATDQVLYNLSRRGIEHDLLPDCRRQAVPVMAYSPIEQGRILDNAALQEIAAAHRATPAQIALAWTLRAEGVVAIPRTGSRAHVQENHGALTIALSQQDLDLLDRAFPAPRGPRPLEML